jgi:hypothetical protein
MSHRAVLVDEHDRKAMVMKILIGDSVVDLDRHVGIVESRSGRQLSIRYPGQGNARMWKGYKEVRLLSMHIYDARDSGRSLQLRRGISLTGDSTLADLVSLFGYSTGRMRTESLGRVLRQLERAGLKIETQFNTWGRDERFWITIPFPQKRNSTHDEDDEEFDGSEPEAAASQDTKPPQVEIPDPFWPTALGLPRVREVEFLRALTLNDPILCILYLPEEAAAQSWLQGTWEGLISWAYRSAQRFHWRHESESGPCQLRVGTSGLIHTYLRPTVLDDSAPRLLDCRRSLNLVTIKREAEQPTEFDRFAALWPGSGFEFKPELGPNGIPVEDSKTVINCLHLAGGKSPTTDLDDPPLKVLLWARRSLAQLMSTAIASWGTLVSTKRLENFKGSNEGAATLSLKAHISNWMHSLDRDAELSFERLEEEDDADSTEPIVRRRVDLLISGRGCFEIESMIGSGPMESFYQRKVFARTRASASEQFWLCVPNDSVLWAGPFLADLAFHLGTQRRVVVPSADGRALQVSGRELAKLGLEEFERKPGSQIETAEATVPNETVTLKDVAGYADVLRQVNELIIWPERHRLLLEGTSKSSGILFFGPPGCGKSRWARAIAGALEQEVRLLSPSDLRGPYIGWSQIMIREQFGWLAEKASRMLIFDELDAVARSRRASQMHEDEKASVNELLVQIDKALRLGRLIVGTTNYVGSLDEAVTRSGRFGRYIPIGPPTSEESVKIIMYYLDRLVFQTRSGGRLSVTVPNEESVRALVVPIFEEDRGQRQYLCGADLEEAVNQAYVRSVRSNLPDGGWVSQTEALDVHLTEQELNSSLRQVPRSITAESVDHFLDDTRRYCGHRLAESLARQLIDRIPDLNAYRRRRPQTRRRPQ